MFKKKTEIHAVPTETATGLALKQRADHPDYEKPEGKPEIPD